MAGRNRRGRAWGELQAQTQQARELAEFLRRLVDQHGFTVRRLQEVMSYGKSTISSNLNGKVPQEQFVLDLVGAVVREPRMKQHVLAEARRLWKAADKPPVPTGVAASPTSALALAHKTNEQLVTVYERNRELERERTGAHQLVLVLVRLVGHLQDQVDELDHRPDAAAELDAVHEQLRVAKQELERARRAREEAELLADRAQQRATARCWPPRHSSPSARTPKSSPPKISARPWHAKPRQPALSAPPARTPDQTARARPLRPPQIDRLGHGRRHGRWDVTDALAAPRGMVVIMYTPHWS